ncbi:hypothetical protein Pyn_02663 [Prunus yedoensis var. nudiflora]|uniref:rRNA-processing protein FCF1 homolog n=1 Tax=Prunus yedoensis var. nudiflora TaxID=2094558 RepID=A0A315ATK5_PRUYE|nr:hypothetical protein Pyn_02663 [Prunus yedoensis var. nudiflora]
MHLFSPSTFHFNFKHKCYIVATCDRDLKRRIRKIPGVPIMYITQHKYSIERLPEATIGGDESQTFGILFELDMLYSLQDFDDGDVTFTKQRLVPPSDANHMLRDQQQKRPWLLCSLMMHFIKAKLSVFELGEFSFL